MDDKRITRTRKNVYSAFGLLLIQKDISEISVKEICDLAEINKSTFYLHFKSIFDCRQQWEDYIFSDVSARISKLNFDGIFTNTAEYIDIFLEFFENHLSILHAIHNTNLFAELMYSFKRRVADIIFQNTVGIIDDDTINLKIAFIVGGTIDACCADIEHFDRSVFEKILKEPFAEKNKH